MPISRVNDSVAMDAAKPAFALAFSLRHFDCSGLIWSNLLKMRGRCNVITVTLSPILAIGCLARSVLERPTGREDGAYVYAVIPDTNLYYLEWQDRFLYLDPALDTKS
jgi:hypothetical protein